MCAGKWIEVVVTRNLTDREWDMDQEEILGVEEDEVIDDGEFELRANQADDKYHALAKSTQFTEEEMKGIDGMDDIASEHEKHEEWKQDSESESEQDNADGGWVSMFHFVDPASCGSG